jgi:hypothetical protein
MSSLSSNKNKSQFLCYGFGEDSFCVKDRICYISSIRRNVHLVLYFEHFCDLIQLKHEVVNRSSFAIAVKFQGNNEPKKHCLYYTSFHGKEHRWVQNYLFFKKNIAIKHSKKQETENKSNTKTKIFVITHDLMIILNICRTITTVITYQCIINIHETNVLKFICVA